MIYSLSEQTRALSPECELGLDKGKDGIPMRVVLGSLLVLGLWTALPVLQAFEAPVYFNMGGPARTDSLGRTWLGDEGAGADANNIRPNDAGGANVIPNWCNPAPASLAALGFDPSHPPDVDIFRSIRWDNAAEPGDYVLEIPLDPGSYTVELYFCEACCPNRHFRVDIQGATAFPDVSSGLYAGGANHVAGSLVAEDVEVGEDGILQIALLPCPAPTCPGGTDGNAILSALAITPTGFDPCSQPGFRRCPGGLGCSIDADTVTGSWQEPVCLEPLGFQVYADGNLIETLPGSATSFSAVQSRRVVEYRVVTLLAEGETPCRDMICTVTRPDVDFEVPLRINMGGRAVVDSLGRKWFGDGPGAGDPLHIRPDDAGGTNTIENWCSNLVVANPDALQSLGYDPNHPNDHYIFNTIRWDNGADAFNYALSLPIPNGDYILNLYFTECCCLNRHFKLEIEGVVVNEDVSAADYSALATPGRTGLLSFPASVADGALDIALLPCPTCPDMAVVDVNAILSAIEVLEAPAAVCPNQLRCGPAAGGAVSCTWTPGSNVALTGYEVYRDGELIEMLPADAIRFTDAPPCRRALLYEVKPLAKESLPCAPYDGYLKAVYIQRTCPFEAPVRINMGGHQATDSQGRLWLGDIAPGADPLDIRPNDAGGSNVAEYWSLGAFQRASFPPFGLDPDHHSDVYIFNTIRWDLGSDAAPYVLELPLEPAVYTAQLYFNEGCCPARHFSIEVEDEVVAADVSVATYAPGLGHLGRIDVERVPVRDGVLKIALIGCLDPVCPGSVDNNAILTALEVLFETSELPNRRPVARIEALPGTEVELAAGSAEVMLDGSSSDDGDGGKQGLSFRWTKLDGPEGDSIASPDAASTDVTFTQAGVYRYELEVDDGQPENNTATAEIEITVRPEAGARFVRGDADANGVVELTDAIVVLSFLFLGGPAPSCMDAADADDDGGNQPVITDAILILSWLFTGGSAPKPPSPSRPQYAAEDCGLDPTEDGMDCRVSPPQCQ
jgi:hypothetical protein